MRASPSWVATDETYSPCGPEGGGLASAFQLKREPAETTRAHTHQPLGPVRGGPTGGSRRERPFPSKRRPADSFRSAARSTLVPRKRGRRILIILVWTGVAAAKFARETGPRRQGSATPVGMGGVIHLVEERRLPSGASRDQVTPGRGEPDVVAGRSASAVREAVNSVKLG